MVKKICTVLLAVFFVYGQSQNLTIDEAIAENVKYFSAKLKAGTKVIVLNIESESKNLSDYIIEETNALIMNGTKLSPVINRNGLSNVLKEKNISDLNEIDETAATQIGKELGVSSVILGSVSKLGEIYRFRVQALNTADGQILGMQSFNVKQDDILADLLKDGKISAKPKQTIGRLGDSQSARARLEAEMDNRGGNSQNAKTSEEKTTLVYTPVPAKAKDDSKSYFLLSAKFQQFNNYYPDSSFYSSSYLFPYKSDKIFPGSFNLEIGGINRSGFTIIGLNNWGPGLFGMGVFLGGTTLKSKIFRFRGGVDLGFWNINTQVLEEGYSSSYVRITYGRVRENFMFGGPHFNFLLGYNPVFVSFGLKALFGFYEEYDMNRYYDKRGMGYMEPKTGFTAMPSWDVGLTFTF